MARSRRQLSPQRAVMRRDSGHREADRYLVSLIPLNWALALLTYNGLRCNLVLQVLRTERHERRTEHCASVCPRYSAISVRAPCDAARRWIRGFRMGCAMGIEGRLDIGLKLQAGRVIGVEMLNNRPVHASRLLHGKGVEDALEQLSMLFAVCGTAQSCAAARACEQARGVAEPKSLTVVRNSLVALETLREHLCRVVMDWAGLIGEQTVPGDVADFMALYRDYQAKVTSDNGPFTKAQEHRLPAATWLRQFDRDLETHLGRVLFAMTPAKWLHIHDPGELESWAARGETVAARMLGHVIENGWGKAGASPIWRLPELDRHELGVALLRDQFVTRPQWHGKCRETTSLTRTDSSLLGNLTSLFGNGLLVRMVARLTEAATLSVAFPDGASVVERPSFGEPGRGVAQVEAARGRLLHAVTLESDIVASYKIVAPTEWNFHPQGVVAGGLGKLKGSRDGIERQARLLINAVDPCVDYTLRTG